MFKGGSKERTIPVEYPVHPNPVPDAWTALQEIEALIPSHHIKSFKGHAEDCQEAWHIAGALWVRLAEMQELVDACSDIVDRDLMKVTDLRTGVESNKDVTENLKRLIAKFTEV